MDNIDDIFNDDDSTVNQEQQGTPEVQPVKLGRFATTGILIVFIIIIIILLLTIKGCTIEKKSQQGVNAVNSVGVSSQDYYNNGEKQGNNKRNDINYGNYSQQVVSGSGETGNVREFSSVIQKGEQSSIRNGDSSVDNSLVGEDLPQLSDMYETQGMVVSKSTYKFENSYTYCVSVALLIGDDAVTGYYFCPKKTYDALNSMDYVKVSFQVAGDDYLSIYSLSKN